METEYQIKFPKIDVRFMGDDFTFLINHMKSRVVSSVYFIVHFFDKTDVEITIGDSPVYISERWVVDNTYSTYSQNFTIPESYVADAVKYQIELRAVNITSENPLYFTECMFCEGDYTDYHIPNEVIKEKEIKFNKSSYANLYDVDGNYLQVIRPTRAKLHTNKLDKCTCTVLAPHLAEEPSIDNPANLFLEFINQTDQRIDVLR